jgi:Sulfotransferase family
MDPYVFVVGSPRSGTTLLQRMLDAHPLLAIANDTHFIPKAIDLDADRDLPMTPEIVDRVIGYHRFHRLGVDERLVRALAAGSDTYADFVGALYGAMASGRGKRFGGEKTPDYVRVLPVLHRLFPGSRFVHIVRDGRDVALSALDWATERKGPGRLDLWASEPVAACALWWLRQVEPGVRAGGSLGPLRYREIAYETLVARPGQTLRELTWFLGLPFSPAMEHFHVGRERDDQVDAKRAWRPATVGLRDWRTDMDPRDIALFEALAGATLTSLGYPRAFPRIPRRIESIARDCIEVWIADRRLQRSRLREQPVRAEGDRTLADSRSR